MDSFTHGKQFTSILPYEIVDHIFLLCCPTIDFGCNHQNRPSSEVPLRLSQVSRTWRAIVHTIPALWTDVCIHNRSAHLNPEILTPILRRSNNRSLSVCMVLGCYNRAGYIERIGACMKELFFHAHRIRSFRLDVRFEEGLWVGLQDVPTPPFPRLEALKVLGFISEQDSLRFFPLFDSPRLHDVTWFSDYQFPEPLLRVGAQIKRLILADFSIEYTQAAVLFQACPNVTHLNVCLKGPYRPVSSHPIRLEDLHTFKSSELGVDLIVAPNLRHLTLILRYRKDLIQDTGVLYEMIHLSQFLSLSPRIEYLHLDLWPQQPFGTVFQIIPLTPCLVTLEISFRAFPYILPLDTMLTTLTHDGSSECTLPQLQHFKLDILEGRWYHEPLTCDVEKLLRMLESRCKPSNQTALDGPPTIAALRSCVMDQRDGHTSRWADAGPKPWEEDTRRRLEVLQQQGVVLGGKVLTSLLDDCSVSQN